MFIKAKILANDSQNSTFSVFEREVIISFNHFVIVHLCLRKIQNYPGTNLNMNFIFQVALLNKLQSICSDISVLETSQLTFSLLYLLIWNIALISLIIVFSLNLG